MCSPEIAGFFPLWSHTPLGERGLSYSTGISREEKPELARLGPDDGLSGKLPGPADLPPKNCPNKNTSEFSSYSFLADLIASTVRLRSVARSSACWTVIYTCCS